ncbi:MAG: DUF488 domain-containing protein [Gammaproteobacteria bacterium]|nr:DUF488 domain-containing protein [Gammaproteobacteria bacterium]
MPHEPRCVWTLGHSTRPLAEFVALFKSYDILRLADVRSIPRSRKNPQFNIDTLPAALAATGIEYMHFKDLGGLRHPRKDSPNDGWRNASFRGFADHMQTAIFAHALEGLIQLARLKPTAIMCAEAVPWRCHRSLIADTLTVRGVEVYHIVSAHKAELHRLTPFARVEETRITYPFALTGSSQET